MSTMPPSFLAEAGQKGVDKKGGRFEGMGGKPILPGAQAEPAAAEAGGRGV